MFHCDCHYTCDICQCVLDARNGERYVLRITACGEDARREVEDDRDYLEEIDDRLAALSEFDEKLLGDEMLGDEDEETTYDLCPACRRKFSLDRLDRRAAPLGFSKN